MAHEDLNREHQIEGSSERSFGVVMMVFFALVACWPLLRDQSPRWWAFVISSVFGVLAWLRPSVLAGLNQQWMKLGLLLGKIVSPIALGILFYAVLTPMGIVMRLAGKDPLRLKRDAAGRSYWILREPPGPPPDSMTNQF
jgi:hypothetical protein